MMARIGYITYLTFPFLISLLSNWTGCTIIVRDRSLSFSSAESREKEKRGREI